MSIEEYFETDEFAKAIGPLKNTIEKDDCFINMNLIEYLVGISIRYSILFGGEKGFSTTGLTDFIQKVSKKISKMDFKRASYLKSNKELTEYISKLCTNTLLEKLNLTRQDLGDEAIRTAVFTYVIKNLEGRKYKYHAFNSANLNSIRKYGINPNISNINQEELNEIDRIFTNHGITMILGWQKLNCDGKVSYSKTPFVSYYYGASSPEWFSQFTGSGFPFNPIEKYEKHAFFKSDYKAAKNNLVTLMQEKNFSPDETDKVLNFFQKNWNIYANNIPMLAVIPENMVEENTQVWTKCLSEYFVKHDMEGLVEYCFFNELGIDCQDKETITTEKATFIRLPNYKILKEKVCNHQESQIAFLEEDRDKKEEEVIHDKLMFLAQAKIKSIIDNEGNNIWVSEHGERELKRVKELLKDEEVFDAIVSDKYDAPFLLGWIKNFDKVIINKPENIKKIALYHPVYFSYVSDEVKNDIELMRECASQQGIQPILTCYVGEKVKDDFEFITRLIINSDENTFDFVGNSTESLKDSNMRYGKSIGQTVRSNPYFWQLLNSKIASINASSSRHIPKLSIEKELELVNNSIMFKDNVDTSTIEIPINRHNM